MTFDRAILKPGDALLYYGDAPDFEPGTHAGFVDWSIAVKTGYWIVHIEIYRGAGVSLASRNGIGVNQYPLRTNGLVLVRRPESRLNLETAEAWFQNTARGQKYDFKGLLCFYLAVRQGSRNKMFCSEFALRWYRKASFEPFNPEVDADRTAPCEFWKCARFDTVWEKENFKP